MSSSTRFRRNYRGRTTELGHNPMFGRQSWQTTVIAHFSLFFLLGVLVFLCILYGLFYSSLFRITTVEISGVNNQFAQELYDGPVHDQLSRMRLVVIPQNSLITFDSQALEQHIADRYTLDSVSVNKKFAHTIRIVLDEKDPALIWYTKEQYYYIDQLGQLGQPIDDVTQQGGGLAQIIDESNEPVDTSNSILSPDTVSYISTLNQRLTDDGRVPVFNYSLPTRLATQLSVHVTDEPYVIYFDTSTDLETQWSKLTRILDDNVIAEKNPREYIDLRIGDRVYFK